MADSISNDNDVARAADRPDAHGQAAMPLVESLIHGLVARAVFSVGDAVEIVDGAAEIHQEIADEAGASPATKESRFRSLRRSVPA